MTPLLRFFLAAVLLLSVSGSFAFAEKPADPKTIIKDIFATAKDEKVATDMSLQGKINKHIDFREMAAKVLGKNSKKVSKDERQWFASTLKKIITKSVYPEAPGFLKGVNIEFSDESVGAKKASITSEVAQKGEVTEVRYELKKSKPGWKVVDISIDDDSWVESIREEVDEVLLLKKWAGLKKRMLSRLKDLESDQKKKTK